MQSYAIQSYLLCWLNDIALTLVKLSETTFTVNLVLYQIKNFLEIFVSHIDNN